jgi:hypothetical protein
MAGAASLLHTPDVLTIGPVRSTPNLHRRDRLKFWSHQYEAAGWDAREVDGREPIVSGQDLARALGRQPDRPVVLWTTGEWRWLLFLAWALSGLHDAGVPARDVWTAGNLRARWPLSYLNPERLGSFAERSAPVEARVRSAARALWRAFLAAEPDGLEAIRKNPPRALPTLRRCLSIYAALLPRVRVRRSGWLGLSAVDEAILGSLSTEEWRRFPDLVRLRGSWPYSGVLAAMCHFGELFVQARLGQWSEGPARAVERLRREDGPYRSSFLLNARGARLLERGLEHPRQMPTIEIGGYRSGEPETWVCAHSGTSWALKLLRR